MEQLVNILSNSEFHAILEQHKRNQEEKNIVAYNIFNLSSYNHHLENFHSDIIASLLDPDGMHQESDTFLREFIHYLNTAYRASIPERNFSQARVTREEGRIDISIVDDHTKSAIIIENKMNDADDMEEQLTRYYNLLKVNYRVYSIVYLTLDGIKKAPTPSKELKSLICNVGAFTNEENDLLNGWLEHCKAQAKNEDSRSLIHQYIKLIKFLAQKNMDSNTNKQFYDFVNKENGLAIAQQLRNLLDELPKYRRDTLSKAITDYTPFKKAYLKWQDYAILYENYWDGVYNYKLDVHFKADGSAEVYLWIPVHNDERARQALSNKLDQIGLLNRMSLTDTEYNSSVIKFKPENYENCMEKVDQTVTEFVKDFMGRLRKLEQNKPTTT